MAGRRSRSQRPSKRNASPTPLFLLGLHRGGTTYVQRVLNCHRQVVLWGENGGLVSHLRRAHDRARNLTQTEAASYQTFASFAPKFVPWASRVDQTGLRRAMAVFIRDLNRAEAPALFWGFKEIRHGNVSDLRFLRSLFPDAHIALLVRHPRDVLLSQLHVSWTPPPRRLDTASRARRFVKRYLRAITAFVRCAGAQPELTRLLRYEDLLAKRAIDRLFAWLDLELGHADLGRLRVVRSRRVGSSFSDVGRPVDAALVERALSAFDAELASSLKRLDARVRAPLLEWYPDLGT